MIFIVTGCHTIEAIKKYSDGTKGELHGIVSVE